MRTFDFTRKTNYFLQVGGTPPPELVWSYMELPIKISNRIGVFNGGMELRISKVLDRDLGDYTCIARNGVSGGRIHHTTKVGSLSLTFSITKILKIPDIKRFIPDDIYFIRGFTY